MQLVVQTLTFVDQRTLHNFRQQTSITKGCCECRRVLAPIRAAGI